MKNIGKFLFSRVFAVNVVLAIIATVMIVFFFTCGLESYTHHGEKITVRPLMGRTLEEVEELLQANKLRYVVRDTGYNEKYEPWTVIGQDPAAGSLVKENRTIYLSINRDEAPKVIMPNVKDQSLIWAKRTLQDAELRPGKVEYKHSPGIGGKDGFVLYAIYNGDTARPGMKINKGATIDLVVSSPEGGPSLVPCVLGKSVMEAQILVQAYDLNLGVFVVDPEAVLGPDYDDTLNAYIYKQVPEPDVEVGMGTPIDIWITDKVLDTLKQCNIDPDSQDAPTDRDNGDD